MISYDPTDGKYLNPTVDRRIAIVTGGYSTIGIYTVLHLYLHGYVVYIMGRNDYKIKQAISQIKQEAQIRVKNYSKAEKMDRYLGDLKSINVDLSNLISVNEAAKKFKQDNDKLHILINNAGLIGAPLQYTQDDYEIQYQVNVIAPFLLTLNLIPCLKNAQDMTPRVINVCSTIYKQLPQFLPPNYKFESSIYDFITRFERYANSKSSLAQLTLQFAQRFPSILFISVHPGFVIGTSLYPDNHFYNLISLPVVRTVQLFTGVSREQGALASIRGAFDESLTLKHNGCYLTTGGEIEPLNSQVQNQANCELVWQWNYEKLKSNGYIDQE